MLLRMFRSKSIKRHHTRLNVYENKNVIGVGHPHKIVKPLHCDDGFDSVCCSINSAGAEHRQSFQFIKFRHTEVHQIDTTEHIKSRPPMLMTCQTSSLEIWAGRGPANMHAKPEQNLRHRRTDMFIVYVLFVRQQFLIKINCKIYYFFYMEHPNCMRTANIIKTKEKKTILFLTK